MEASKQKLQMTMMETADMAHSLVVTGLRDSFLDVFFVYAFSDVRSKREMLKRLTTKSNRCRLLLPRGRAATGIMSPGRENACAGLRWREFEFRIR